MTISEYNLKRRSIRVPLVSHRVNGSVLFPDDYNVDDDSLADIIASLSSTLTEAPAEHRDNVRISISSDYESSGAQIEIYYDREETDEEYNKRIEALRADERHIAAKREKKERAEYERLKQKYGGA